MKLLYSMISARRSDVRKHMLLARRPLHEKRKGRGDIMGSASNGVSLDVGEVEAQPGLSKRSRLKRFGAIYPSCAIDAGPPYER
jgi:hypothetical protein